MMRWLLLGAVALVLAGGCTAMSGWEPGTHVRTESAGVAEDLAIMWRPHCWPRVPARQRAQQLRLGADGRGV